MAGLSQIKEDSSIFGVEKIQARYLDPQSHVFISLDFTSHPKVKLHHEKLPTFAGFEGLAVVFLKGWHLILIMEELVH